MKKIASVLMIAAIMAMGTETVQSAPELVTICYYGVTMKVSQKIAKRYFKLGATEGSCQEQEIPEECSNCPIPV